MKKTKKVEPLKYFREQYEARRMAFGGAMEQSMNEAVESTDTVSGPGNPVKPKKRPTKGRFHACWSGRCT